jgi:tetratricopeptide (TPR) repeat protein
MAIGLPYPIPAADEAPMNPSLRSIAGLVLVALAAISAQAQSYDEELQRGVEAYEDARFEEAMGHFRKATELDPGQSGAHLYLATALVSQYIPGVDSPDNLQYADQAIEQYQHVLDSDADRPSRLTSLKGIAYLYLNMKQWDESKTYYQKASVLDPNDPEDYYSIGVIDWTGSYESRQQGRALLGMKPEDYLSSRHPEQKKLCDELRARNLSAVEEGIDNLNKAVRLRPDYDDAMAYMNLMYREKADLECDAPSLRAQELRTADEWVDKAMAAKKHKAEKSNGVAPTTAPNPQ